LKPPFYQLGVLGSVSMKGVVLDPKANKKENPEGPGAVIFLNLSPLD